MKNIILFLLVWISLVHLIGLSDPKGAAKVLKDQGYTEVEIEGYTFFGCGEGDVFRTSFSGKTIAGISVSGTVCKGFFKGATIRID